MTDTTLPVFEAFGSQARRAIIRYFAELDPDARVQMREILDEIEFSRESVRKNITGENGVGLVVVYGFVDIEDPAAPAPFYKPADTEVMEQVREHGIEWLEPLVQTTGSQRLTDWYVTDADPNESYSATAIQRVGGANYRTAEKYLEVFHEVGLLEYDDDSAYDEYSLNADSDVYQRLGQLNDLLYETYNERKHLLDEIPRSV